MFFLFFRCKPMKGQVSSVFVLSLCVIAIYFSTRHLHKISNRRFCLRHPGGTQEELIVEDGDTSNVLPDQDSYVLQHKGVITVRGKELPEGQYIVKPLERQGKAVMIGAVVGSLTGGLLGVAAAGGIILNSCLAAVGAGVGSGCVGKVEDAQIISKNSIQTQEECSAPQPDAELKPVTASRLPRSFDLETSDLSKAVAQFSNSDISIISSECTKYASNRSIDLGSLSQRQLLRMSSFVAGKVLHSNGISVNAADVATAAKQLTAGIDDSSLDDAILITLSIIDSIYIKKMPFDPREDIKDDEGLQQITWPELESHDGEQASAWIAIYSRIYDVSKFVDEHPGGPDTLLQKAGQDATWDWEAVGHTSERTLNYMKGMLVGKLVGENPRLKQKKSKQASKNTDMTPMSPNSDQSFITTISIVILFLAALAYYML